jgi:transposase-like protein
MARTDPEPEVFVPPSRCPSCGGKELTTTSKAADRTAYWRCLTCGEIWNLERRSAGARYGFRR